MAELVASTEVTLQTEFATFSADQPPPTGAASYPQSYAASAPGAVAMMTGTKYAKVSLRLERWTGRPPDVPGWEDCDELLWRTLSGERLLVARNEFEPGSGEPLPLGELESGQVRVSARGRHRYFYGDTVASLPPEQWLVQLWPEAGAIDPFAGPGRRIGKPWQQPLRAWQTSGWYALLSTFQGFPRILSALGRFPDGFTQAAIQADWVATCFGDLPPTRWEDPTSTSAPIADGPATGERMRAWVSEFVARRGLPPVVAIDDLWKLMVDVGMIAPTGSHVFVVTEPTMSAVEESSLPADVLAEIDSDQARHVEHEAGYLAGDIGHLVKWSAGGTLVTTPAHIAKRCDVEVDLVIAALSSRRLLCSVDPDPALVGVDTIITVQSSGEVFFGRGT